LDYNPGTSTISINEQSSDADGAPVSIHLYALSGKFDSGVWFPVAFRFNFAAGNLFTMLDNGLEQMTHLSDAPPLGSILGYTVVVGFPKGPPAPIPEQAHYDNFVCDVTP
jgi:hypothetical protein